MRDRSAYAAIETEAAYERLISLTNRVQIAMFGLSGLSFAVFFAMDSEYILVVASGIFVAALALFLVRAVLRTASLASVAMLLRHKR